MNKRFQLLVLMIGLLSFDRCGLFEPDRSPGSLKIILKDEERSNSLEKAAVNLSSIQCIVKKGSVTKFDGNLTKQGSSFHGEIPGLEPGSDYSVLLYGKEDRKSVV